MAFPGLLRIHQIAAPSVGASSAAHCVLVTLTSA